MQEIMRKGQFSVISFFSEEQTYINEQQTLKIIFNGYFLNRRQLIGELRGNNSFKENCSDGELMLFLYEKYGKNCLHKAKGMYSFAVYSMTEGTLFLARDRAGGKPLYYSKGPYGLVFGPDLKGMIRENIVNREINKTALSQYLMLSYIPAPLTILENVFKLPAGHYLKMSGDGDIILEEYWDIVYDEKEKIRDYEECKRRLRDSLFQSVEDCLSGNTSTGILLSGGIDSNIIAGIMSQISDRPVETFSIGYTGVKDYDESDRAVLSAKFHRSNHHLFFIEYKNIVENIEKVIDNIDEPYADSSYIPTYTISQIAGEHVHTVLTGDAGDELFAGYDKYLVGYYGNLYKKIPAIIRNSIIEPAIDLLPANREIVRKLNKVISNSDQDTYLQRRNMMCLGLQYGNIDKLLRYDENDSLNFIKKAYDKYANCACEIDRTLYTDFKVVLEGDMLTKANRTSELAGIVSKAPLLHSDVVELAAKIPVEFKIKGKNRKIILKETFADCIPEKIVSAKKIGFGVPVSYWFLNELRRDLQETLNREIIEKQGLLNPDYVEHLVEEHLSGTRNNSGILWALYVFEKWYKKYILNI